jgi:N-sulfoglucosamine sulfohydrolase
MTEKPNIILFITHDQGQFLGCYDSPRTPNSLITPNLDKIAENGVRFTNYFCTAPQCSPSRGSIITSKYPHQNGLMGLIDRGWTLPEENKTLPMYLKESGYSTHLLGFQHESFNAKTLGYDTISKRGPEWRYSPIKMEKSYREFFNEHKNDETPFYVCIGVPEVHRPFGVWAESVSPEIVKVPPYLPDNKIIREDLAKFYGAIQSIDTFIGNILKFLEDNNLRDNSLFIYTTDHGEPFPRAKCTLYDPGIKTLLIMSWLNLDIIQKGSIYNQMISNIDLLPTILEMVGAKVPDSLEGKSFLSILKENSSHFRKEIYTTKSFHEYYDPIRAIRTGKFKYIINFEKFETSYQVPMDMLQDPIGKFIIEKIKKPRDHEELYDLEKDPREMNNLINHSDYTNIYLQLKQKLFKWMERTNDPILKGKIQDKRSTPPKRY